MEVVEHQHQGSFARRTPEERRQRVVQAEAQLGGIDRRRRRQIRKRLGERRDGLGDLGRAGAEHAGELPSAAPARVGTQDLDEGPEGRGALALEALADVDLGPLLARALGEFVGEPCLADAGRTDDACETALAAERAFEPLVELGERVDAADQRHARARRRVRVRAALPGLDALDPRHEAIADAPHRPDHRLAVAGIAHREARAADGARERTLADAFAGPERLEDLRLRDGAVAMPSQVDQQRQYLGLDGDRRTGAAKLEERVVEFPFPAVAESNDHPRSALAALA